MKSLKSLFVMEVQNTVATLTFIGKSMPKVAKAAMNEELSARIGEYGESAVGTAAALTEVLQEMGEKAKGGIVSASVQEAVLEIIAVKSYKVGKAGKADAGRNVRDAYLILLMQRFAHCQGAQFGTLVSWSALIDIDCSAAKTALDYVKDFDEDMTELAEETVNVGAVTEEAEAASA